jgi:hypothetical protein
MPQESDRVEWLEADARYARERLELYRAKAYGRPTSATRMRELERASELAEERLRAAKAGRARSAE